MEQRWGQGRKDCRGSIRHLERLKQLWGKVEKRGVKDLASVVGHGNLWGEDRVKSHPEKPQDIFSLRNLRKTVEDFPVVEIGVGEARKRFQLGSEAEAFSTAR